MPWQQESVLELVSPTSFDETQIQLLGRAVNFIAYNRMAD
jgi:hypothetical protein